MFKPYNILKSLTIRRLRYFSTKKDYYAILGISKDATKAQIKKAFTQKAKEYHPDKNHSPDAKDKFANISEAYQTLNDENKRKVYDAYGMNADEQKNQYSQGFNNQGFEGFWNQSNMGGFENMFTDFEDIFGFGTGKRPKRTAKGADIILSLELSFMEAIMGASKDIVYKVQTVCGTCNGSKCKPGTSPVKCAKCDGKGNNSYRQGPMVIQMTCEGCMGAGTVIKDHCIVCKGSGISYKQNKETIKIPAGIDTGKNLRLGGKGSLGENGGEPGDIIIKISVKPDPYFRRDGCDIYTDIKLSIAQAVLGDTIDAKTVYGMRKITVPPGTNHGSKIKIPNEGVKKLDSELKGDHYCVCNVHVPKSLNEDEKKIFERLKELDQRRSGTNATSSEASRPWIFDKLSGLYEKSE